MEREILERAINRVRRRIVANQVLSEAARAASVCLIGPVLLLLVGTRFFVLPILCAFVLTGLGVAMWHLWRDYPDLYLVAQMVDGRMAAHDQISTAIHFLNSKERAAHLQRQTAVRLLQHSDPVKAFPLCFPRSLYGLAGVLLLGIAFYGVRHSVDNSLQMRQPLSSMVLQALDVQEPQQESARLDRRNASSESPKIPGAGEPPAAAQGEMLLPDQDDTMTGIAGEPEHGNRSGDPGRESLKDGADNAQSGDPNSREDSESTEGQGDPRDASPGDDTGVGGSENLLSRLRNTMNSLMSHLQMKSAGAAPRQASTNPEPKKEETQPAGERNRNGEEKGSQSGGEQVADAGRDKTESSNPQASTGETGEKTQDQNSLNAPGKQDGSKLIGEAQKQKEMGKLSELYGRRTAGLTGDMTVEARPGKQSLNTPQSGSAARHRDTGGEVSRDEIPPGYEEYIKEYFAKLRAKK